MPGSQPNTVSAPLADRLAAYGCTDIVRLDVKLFEPRQLEYLDLLPKQDRRTPSLNAVAEHQGTALLYLVDAGDDSNASAASLTTIRHRLANRSDPAWFGVVRAGSLEVFPIGFHLAADSHSITTIEAKSATAPLFFQSLVHGTFEGSKKVLGTDYVYRKIFDLLTQTTDEFVPRQGNRAIDALEVLSMAGQALFFRFLIDRRIVLESELAGPEGICPTATDLKAAFSSAKNAARTSAWLDATFNGDFLPLVDETIPFERRAAREKAYLSFYDRTQKLVGTKIFTHLQAILRGWKAVGDAFQPEFDWGDLDFAHIPVGVLSQVYESFSHRADPRTARDTSIHYTPRTIAKLMVDEAFAAVKDPAAATILDSSCGAGIFLVLAFRRLVRERWLRDNNRPTTAAIQEILYKQLRGFDISEPALRLAALGLYITAIELNASPRPPNALKFPRNLRDEVLFRFGAEGGASNNPNVFPLGSLGGEVPSKFDKQFHIVIGNPPWTRLRDPKDEGQDGTMKKQHKSDTDRLNAAFTAVGRRVLSARGLGEVAKDFENPDKNPDIPFLWRAMEWCRDGGVIALAMPARLIGRTTGKGFEAWRAILRSVEITGIINGANLRKTAVWESVDMPFCLLFACNRIPDASHHFQFAAPSYEPALNGEGRFRIDYESARPIGVSRVEQQPWILKTLSLGTWLDIELMEALLTKENTSLGSRWEMWDPKGNKTGKGYDRSPGLAQKPAEFLAELLDFQPKKGEFTIPFDELITYFERHGARSAYWPKTEHLYQPPLVIIPKAPGDSPLSPKAYYSNRPIAFSQSYYGYSCAGHPEAEILASLIYILPHSMLFHYFSLMVSVSQGADHMIFTKQDFDTLPFPDLASVPPATKAAIRSLAKGLQTKINKPWDELNEVIFGLYGLDADAVQVAHDTLLTAVPYRKAGRSSFDFTNGATRNAFFSELRELLDPYFDVCGEHVAVREPEFQPDVWREPWYFLAISRNAVTVEINENLVREAMKAANDRGCSRITVHAPKKSGLLLGLLNQRRWWTVTRARLCAQHIIRQHLGAFGLPEAP